MTTLAPDRLAAADVREVAAELQRMVAPTAERVEIAGSLRRGSATVKDVELCVLNPSADFYAMTDGMIAQGVAQKALYGATNSTRWGDRYRGLVFRGVRFELFAADSDNWGYIWWLRTGPGDANQYLVTQIKYRATFNVHDGYVWHDYRKLGIGSERDWFALLGMPVVVPEHRSVHVYKGFIAGRNHRWGDPADFLIVEKAEQAELFDDVGGDIPRARVERGGKSEAERRYIAEHYTRRYGETVEFWLRPDAPNPFEYAQAKRGEG